MSMRQVGLLTAGAQPWSPRMCAACGERFAYCSTLAIYIYEVFIPFLYKLANMLLVFKIGMLISKLLLQISQLIRELYCSMLSVKLGVAA